jgi:hypothetical protein
MKASAKTHVLTVREVPDAVYRTLRERAAASRRSMQQEVRHVLEADTQRPAFDWEGLQRLRVRTRGKVPSGDSLRLLHELRGR